jgi:hypothetical protein
MDWVKTITELIKALGHFAWPVLVGLIIWWFRKEIPKALAVLIARISKFKGFGFEFETREEFQQALKDAKEGIPEQKIQELKNLVQPVLLEDHVKATLSVSATPEVIEGLNALMERALLDPRAAIRQSWELLAKTVFRIANVPTENLNPYSEEMSRALKRLEGDTKYSEELILSIKRLHEIARKVFFQSQWAYDPSPNDVQEFVLYSAAARADLGEEVK